MLANNSLLLRDRSFYEKYSFLFVPAVIETMKIRFDPPASHIFVGGFQ